MQKEIIEVGFSIRRQNTESSNLSCDESLYNYLKSICE